MALCLGIQGSVLLYFQVRQIRERTNKTNLQWDSLDCIVKRVGEGKVEQLFLFRTEFLGVNKVFTLSV